MGISKNLALFCLVRAEKILLFFFLIMIPAVPASEGITDFKATVIDSQMNMLSYDFRYEPL